MALKVFWTSEAADDLQSITEFIAQDSEFYAKSFAGNIIQAADNLDILALRGRIVPEFDDPQIRELFVKKYRLIYKIEDNRVIVLAIIHGRREI